MKPRSLHDGQKDGLRPLASLDLGRVGSFAGLVRAMADTAFAGRQLGEALEIILEMARDPDCLTVLTLSGAMTVAKQGLIVCETIDRGIAGTVIATGALMAHGLTESIGLAHYRVEPGQDDTELFEKGYNRIYDTLEMESNLNEVAELLGDVLNKEKPQDGVWSSARLCRAIGRRLDEMNVGRGILRSAYRKGAPVFIPAFTDSEIGLDCSTWAMRQALKGKDKAKVTYEDVFVATPVFNPFLDMQEYARLIGSAKRMGIITVGGGVPRNWAQQVAPYYEITNDRLGLELPVPRFQYGVRICPEPVHWGGLSGCTYSEGVSWGKFAPTSEGGRYAEIHCDATAVLPLLMKAVFEELDKDKGSR